MSPQPLDPKVKRTKTVIPLVVLGLAMLGLGFASKPLYDTFCKVTGYGGTTGTADALSTTTVDREIKIRFDANTRSDLNWSFKPVDNAMTVKLGQNGLAFYTATNHGHTASVGTASYNVTPIKAAPYFSKIQCFCFTEQKLEAGESVRMPVLFFVDPLMAEDPRLDEIKTITLSYTFHAVQKVGDDVQTSESRAKSMAEIEAIAAKNGLN